MLFLYLAVVITAMYWVSKTLGPEIAKPPVQTIRKASSRSRSLEITPDEINTRIEKLETLLAEKNKNIQLLQTELKIFHVQLRDFDKVKMLMEEEIHRLREQNRIFRSELGLPTVAPKESLIS